MAQRQFRSDDTDLWIDRYGDGSDGAITYSGSGSDTTPNTSLTGTGGGTSATVGSGTGFANGNLVLIHQTQGAGAGQWELNKISSVGGGTNWTMAYNLINTYVAGAQVYLLKQYSAVTINNGVILNPIAWDGTKGGIFAFLCNGTVTNNGTMNLKSYGFRGPTTYNSGSGVIQLQGEGTGGVGTQLMSANGNGGGGGKNETGAGANNIAAGAAGGNAAAGGNGRTQGPVSTGGLQAGTANLTNMVFGGASGKGGTPFSLNPSDSASGVSGAGIFLVISKNITAGIVIADGTQGLNGFVSGAGSAGGSILLKGQNITLGSTTVTALKGVSYLNDGTADGSVGRIHADYGMSISGTTNPTIDTTNDLSLNEKGGGLFYGQI